jgi:NAD(P)-dependent dehydrogenase (short-subunit alcohol dehydrogenase family)
LKSELDQIGTRSHFIQADVSDPDECKRLMSEAAAAFGRIDHLASNAGVENFAALEEIRKTDFDRIFGINVAAQLFATQAAVPFMTRGSRIVLTSSASARIPIFHHTLYAASKAAIRAIALNLAVELGEKGIAINAVAPGGTQTDMGREAGSSYINPALAAAGHDNIVKATYALQRLAVPNEIASAIAFLLSEEASFITGSTLAVDGGHV